MRGNSWSFLLFMFMWIGTLSRGRPQGRLRGQSSEQH
jgi:hypothetical protein